MDYEKARNKMVDNQIIARKIHNTRLIAAMRKVPRHEFISERYRRRAYQDTPLPIAENQTISQPYIVALMIELLNLQGMERVLEIGTGSGYQAAILAELAEEVISIERIIQLSTTAKEKLGGYHNLRLIIGNGAKGYPDRAPYHAIIVSAAAKELPAALTEQLAPTGILIAPVGNNSQHLIKLTKEGGKQKREVLCPVRFVPLINDDY